MNAIAFPTLDQVVRQVRRLPALRAIVLDVLGSLERPQTNLAELAQGMSRDLVLSASVLRIVNSPFYGLAHRISSVSQAALILGTSNLRGIIVAAALVNDCPVPRDGSFDVDRFWLHSFASAIWSRLLAERRREPGDIAFTAGLLHDVGKIVLAINFGEVCSEVTRRAQAEGRMVHEIEGEMLGYDHASVGAELLAHWRLPQRLGRLVAMHHALPQDGEDPMFAVVRTADRVAHLLEPDEASAAGPLRLALRLPEADTVSLLDAARRECAPMRALLHGGKTAESAVRN